MAKMKLMMTMMMISENIEIMMTSIDIGGVWLMKKVLLLM